jgi:hypothetical protein
VQKRDKLAQNNSGSQNICASNVEERDCVGMSQTMKAVALTTTIIIFIFAATTMASAAPVACSQAAQNASNLAANIAGSANTYWAHRKNFVDVKFGQLRNNTNAKALADAEVSQAGQSKALMPNNLANFRAAIAIVRSQNCLSATQLRAIEETATTQARKVNFDQLPADETEATTRPGKMPQ